MPEPDEQEVKDFDGYTWVHVDKSSDPLGGWSLKNHDELCYLNIPWSKVQSEYGPMHLMGE